jgi:hypothetical protein
MSIIRVVDWVPPNAATFPTMQDYRENPDGPYRELLMAEDENGDPIPYNVPTGSVVRIPHAMGIGSQGVQGQAVGVAQARIPDVVIPVLVADMVLGPPDGLVSLLWDATGIVAGGPSTGMWVDENYVYLYVGGDRALNASFVVYVEYTHSVIRNEVVTADYFTLVGGLGGGAVLDGGLGIP